MSLLDHLVRNGPDTCAEDAKANIHKLNTLFEFSYKEGNIERGNGVRDKSKQLAELIKDKKRLKAERKKAIEIRKKLGANVAISSEAMEYIIK